VAVTALNFGGKEKAGARLSCLIFPGAIQRGDDLTSAHAALSLIFCTPWPTVPCRVLYEVMTEKSCFEIGNHLHYVSKVRRSHRLID
jgi:hypothetical protein